MFIFSKIRQLYLAYFSKPAADRVVYRTIRRQRTGSILEIGIGSGVRSLRMISLAKLVQPEIQPRYVGVDLFEGRPATPDQPCLTLKQAHCQFKATGAAAQVVPGDPFSALSRVANSLREIDLVIISHDQQGESLERAWFYVPRMLHAGSIVFEESLDSTSGLTTLRQLDRSVIEERAQKATTRKRAA